MRGRPSFAFVLVCVLCIGCVGVPVPRGHSTIRSVEQEATPPRGDSLADVARIMQASPKLLRAMRRMTPEDEHAVGRAAAAAFLSETPLWENRAAQTYVRRVGQVLTDASREPIAWDGYRFFVLDDPSPGAWACPGAFVLITRGLLERLGDEDQLAAVLAHELAHLQGRHTHALIREKRWYEFSAVALTGGLAVLPPRALDRLTDALQGMSGSLYESLRGKGWRAFDARFEDAADSAAVELLRAAGYDPAALAEALEALRKDELYPQVKKRLQRLPRESTLDEARRSRRLRFEAVFER